MDDAVDYTKDAGNILCLSWVLRYIPITVRIVFFSFPILVTDYPAMDFQRTLDTKKEGRS